MGGVREDEWVFAGRSKPPERAKKLGFREGERKGGNGGKSCGNQDFWLLVKCHLSTDNGQNLQTKCSS